jgi:hypothetical protein
VLTVFTRVLAAPYFEFLFHCTKFLKTLKFFAILSVASILTIVTLPNMTVVHTINMLLVVPLVKAFPNLT